MYVILFYILFGFSEVHRTLTNGRVATEYANEQLQFSKRIVLFDFSFDFLGKTVEPVSDCADEWCVALLNLGTLDLKSHDSPVIICRSKFVWVNLIMKI